MTRSLSSSLALLIGTILGAPIPAQVTQRVSLSSSGLPGDRGAYLPLTGGDRIVSDDGRYVIFMSESTDLVPGDTNATGDVFLRDRQSGTTELVSVATGGGQGNAYSGSLGLAITPDGRYVVFTSFASDLVPGDTNGVADVFLRDRRNGTTERISVSTGGVQGNDQSVCPAISADGRFVAFDSYARNLVPGDSNGVEDIFVRDRLLGTTERVSVDSSGTQGNHVSGWGLGVGISADGRFVAFTSAASNLVPGDTNGFGDVFVHDRLTGRTEIVSVDSHGIQADWNSFGSSISADGRFVAFVSFARNLVPGDSNGYPDVFVHDRRSGETERVSVDSQGIQGNHPSDYYYLPGVSISGDGRYVAFTSTASNLVPGGTFGYDVFVRDRRNGTTELASVTTAGAQASGHADSQLPSITADGRYVVFRSSNEDLDPANAYGLDVFLHDRSSTGFTSLCDPGLDGVIACPCSNPAAGGERGCDNSAGTGGASLSASGIAYLSLDSLVFTTSGEKPTATSILLQGSASVPGGATYGQGVRCAAGVLERLFTKTASSGSITAPDFVSGDPLLSTRSAALGDVIQPGQSRWYLVYYRDSSVLGGCPASSTFNATQTGRIDWSL